MVLALMMFSISGDSVKQGGEILYNDISSDALMCKVSGEYLRQGEGI